MNRTALLSALTFAASFSLRAPGAPGPPASAPAVPANRKLTGYHGIWYANQPTHDEYKYKYSGGLGTYPQQHVPVAIHAPEADKTFFVYGGAHRDAYGSGQQPSLLIMVSCFDHKTGTVPRPTLLIDKATTDAHDNPTLLIDGDGHLWVFAASHGTARPAYIFRSVRPYDVDEFELVSETSFSYPQPWYVPGQGICFLHTRYTDQGRTLNMITSRDGRDWSEPRLLAAVERGHYQISGRSANKIGTAFNVHPAEGGLNARTNLYYMESADFGQTWRTADGKPLDVPLRAVANDALVRDYAAENQLVYLKDINFDARGNPAILYLLSPGFEPGSKNDPRVWAVARWDGRRWDIRVAMRSDHNYDTGSLYLERADLWRIIAPTAPGPQAYCTGGEVVMWESDSRGASWRPRPLTFDSPSNHTYVRRPVNAHPDFYAFWADGDPRKPSASRLYFCDVRGTVYVLPNLMVRGDQKPIPAYLPGGKEPSRLEPAPPEVFLETPRAGVRVNAYSVYTRPTGLDLVSRTIEQTKSDTADVAYQRFSNDNGVTWSEPQKIDTFAERPGGTFRRSLAPDVLDPDTGRLLGMITQGVLPSDHPLEGMKHWTLHYRLSKDGGKTFYHEAPVIHEGAEFTPDHPLPDVWIGKNSVMLGDLTCRPITIRTGEILQPVQITPLGEGGEYVNPGGGYTYHDAAVLIARWKPDDTLSWTLSRRVTADPALSTRGMIEPTIAEMPDGRILMVLRGSNDVKPDLPGRRWYAVSDDHGRSWSEPKPWSFATGEAFFSPSSCSQLLPHANGRVYWIGNVCPENPRGNGPRYPLVIVEVDRLALYPIAETLRVVADRAADDPPWTAFSNFFAREDRDTHDIVVHCSPLGTAKEIAADAPKLDWTADALLYRVKVTPPPPQGP